MDTLTNTMVFGLRYIIPNYIFQFKFVYLKTKCKLFNYHSVFFIKYPVKNGTTDSNKRSVSPSKDIVVNNDGL